MLPTCRGATHLPSPSRYHQLVKVLPTCRARQGATPLPSPLRYYPSIELVKVLPTFQGATQLSRYYPPIKVLRTYRAYQGTTNLSRCYPPLKVLPIAELVKVLPTYQGTTHLPSPSRYYLPAEPGRVRHIPFRKLACSVGPSWALTSSGSKNVKRRE